MPTRKVIQLAGKTLVVSLPSKWAKRCGVRKGDEIDVDESGRRLILGASSSKDAGKASIDLTGLSERTIRWVLSALHKKGYDEIEAKYSDAKSLKIIEELMKDLFTGFAIIRQGNNKCTIKAIAKESEEEFDSILRRAFLVTMSMGDNIVDLMKKDMAKSAPEILVLEKTNNQLTNFCERILIKKGAKMSENSCMTYAIVWNLEKTHF
jgi:phosphate uptake regulator